MIWVIIATAGALRFADIQAPYKQLLVFWLFWLLAPVIFIILSAVVLIDCPAEYKHFCSDVIDFLKGKNIFDND